MVLTRGKGHEFPSLRNPKKIYPARELEINVERTMKNKILYNINSMYIISKLAGSYMRENISLGSHRTHMIIDLHN